MSLVRLPSEGVEQRVWFGDGAGRMEWTVACSSEDSLSESRLASLRVKKRFHEGAGESEWVAGRLWSSEEAEPRRRMVASDTETGAGRGVLNLASGSIVLKLSWCIEVRDALRCRKACSMGTLSVLTVWPGR